MTTLKISGQAQLLSAMKTAKSGDVLSLAGGNYGSVNLKSYLTGVTITSASDTDQAVFTKLVATKATGLVLDNLTFDGVGGVNAGNGLVIANSTDVKVLNSDFTDYKIGSFIYEISGLTMSGNNFTRMYHDAMDFTDIQGGIISKNTYQEAGSEPDYAHKDFIQFWTNKANDQRASSNIEITGNKFYSKDGDTHGIFINNEWKGQKYEGLYIHDNLIKSSHTHGITVNYANNLVIQNNMVIKDGSGTPAINVTPDSTNVKILYNTAPSVADLGDASWVVEHNKETAGNVYQWTNGISSGLKINNVGPYFGVLGSNGVPLDADPSNGFADSIVFKGTAFVAGSTSKVWGLDFSEGDVISFNFYEAGTFEHKRGGNYLAANATGTYVKIDSLVDLQELVAVSPDVEARVDGDTLLLSIAQIGGAQTIAIEGWGQEYAATYNELLF